IRDVTITTDNGWIQDDGAADGIDIFAGGTITLLAGTGIGVDGAGVATHGTPLILSGPLLDLQTTSATAGQGSIAVTVDSTGVAGPVVVNNLVSGNQGSATGFVDLVQVGGQDLVVNNVLARTGVTLANDDGLTTGAITNTTSGGV